MYDIYDVTGLFFLMLVVTYWWRVSDQKNFALTNIRAYCKERELQLLDQTLVFKKFKLDRGSRGQRLLCRTYEFDFCEYDEERLKGEILISGFQVIRVILQKDELEITQY